MTAIIPTTGFIRQSQLLGNKSTGYLGVLPVSAATLWRWVGAGEFPQPVRLGKRVTAWRAEDVNAWIREQGQQPQSH